MKKWIIILSIIALCHGISFFVYNQPLGTISSFVVGVVAGAIGVFACPE